MAIIADSMQSNAQEQKAEKEEGRHKEPNKW